MLEARANVRELQRVPCITVEPGETVEEVLAREGVVPVEGQRVGLIVRQIVEPDTEAAEAARVATAGQPNRKAARRAGNGADAAG